MPRLAGERGKFIATIAQTRGKISETNLQILQIDQDLRSEDSKDLRETQAKIAELAERKIAIEDQMRRIDLRSPQAGAVHQLAVHAAGAVVSPGEQIMVIVPSNDTLVLEAKIAPQDIDHVLVGQDAIVRLSAFNQRTTPEIDGKVTFVAAELIKEPARITLNASQLGELEGVKLVPGMPAEVHLATGERTAMSYFLKPIRDQVGRAFKEK